MWPALSSKSLQIEYLSYKRGVWGKVHGAASDFRWIALSEPFDFQLERQLNLGSEDKPRTAVFWRCLPNSYYAIATYPSRASDASGRSGFLEKQVIEWQKSQDIPAVVLALFFLPLAKKFDDKIWWKHRKNSEWYQNNFSLPIAPSDCTPLPYSETLLAKAIENSINQLKMLFKENQIALIQFYKHLLSGQKPVYLQLRTPISPEALAGLLLPLKRELADKLSLTGWVPSSRFENLSESWDCIILPENYDPPYKAEIVFDSEIENQAIKIVEAIFTNKPSLLTEAKISSINFAPNEDSSEYLQEIYRFAMAPERRWLADEYLSRFEKQPLSVEDREKIGIWAKWVEENKPDYADAEQWQVKVNLLKKFTNPTERILIK
jgi:hypothetical protein